MPDDPVSVTFGNLPNSDGCWGTPQEFVDLLNQIVTATVSRLALPYNYGPNQPDADHQDRPWAKVESTGQPIGWFNFYKGYWRPFPRAQYGDLKFVSIAGGDLSTYLDADGRGKPDTDFDGWQITNGQNGAPDTRGLFNKSAALSSPGEDGTVYPLAGAKDGVDFITLTEANLPPLSVTYDKLVVPAPGNGFAGGGNLFLPPQSTTTATATITTGDPEQFSVVNKYIAFIQLCYIGYA